MTESNLNILIVEDQWLEAEVLTAWLGDMGYQHITICHNSKDAFQQFKSIKPDLVLMDIDLNEADVDGIALAKAFYRVHPLPIIYLTGSSDERTYQRAKVTQYANFLIKPTTARQLYIAIDTALERFHQSMEQEETKAITTKFISAKDHFFVKGSDRYYYRVNVEDILWIEAVRGGVQIVTEQHNYMLTASLSSFIKQFEHPLIIRVHRSFAINKNKVSAIQERSFLMDYKKNEKVIPCSKAYWEEVKDLFDILRAD